MRIDLSRLKHSGYYGISVIFCLALSFILLAYYLFHDPYKDLHSQIFEIAHKVNNYYREKPNYWKLSTESAEQDNLLGTIRKDYAKYDFSIGKGAEGDVVLPNDVSFDIALKHLSKSACISLSEYKIEEKQRLSLLKIAIVTKDKTTEFSWGEDPKLPVEKYAARNVCGAAENTLIWTFQ